MFSLIIILTIWIYYVHYARLLSRPGPADRAPAVDLLRKQTLQWQWALCPFYMRYSALFGKTYREIPHELKSISQILLVQGGFIRFLGQGLYSYLPLGMKVLKKIEALIRAEMEKLGGQEVRVPLVNPAEIWRRGGREGFLSSDLARFRDRAGREMVLAPSHEEAVVELVRAGLRSYRDLPIFLYQLQTKFRDEKKTKSGMIRAREFVMKDAYSFHRTYHELNNFFPKVFAAYQRIFSRCNVEALSAEGSVGFMGGEKAYEFLMPMEAGENVLVICDSCGYRANLEVARGIKNVIDEEPLDIEEVDTPGCATMNELAGRLNLPKERLAKAVVYRTVNRLVMAIVRADYEISREKLAFLLQEPVLGLASNSALAELGLIKGYLSPLGRDDLFVVVDDTIARSANLVYGSNTECKHLLNVNYGRDYTADVVGDIALSGAGRLCLQCHGELSETPAIELGNIFKLTDFYSRSMNLHFQDENGESLYPQMGSYGIGLGRLLSAVVESNHDERGIAWPPHLAPFSVYIMGIGRSTSVRRVIERLHEDLQGIALFDDRHESPGVKFTDCEVIGIPLRIVISSRLLERGKAELHERKSGKTWEVDVEKMAGIVKRYVENEELDGIEAQS